MNVTPATYRRRRLVVGVTALAAVIATMVAVFTIAERLGLEPCDETTTCGQMLPATR